MADRSGLKSAISMLLVEDDKPTLEFLGNILARKYPEITIHTADDGRKGLELFQAFLPDIVITDCNMPEMHGMHMAREIRAIKPDTKLIILTGDTGQRDMEEAAGKGCKSDSFIVKPVVFENLFGAINQCVDKIAPR